MFPMLVVLALVLLVTHWNFKLLFSSTFRSNINTHSASLHQKPPKVPAEIESEDTSLVKLENGEESIDFSASMVFDDVDAIKQTITFGVKDENRMIDVRTEYLAALNRVFKSQCSVVKGKQNQQNKVCCGANSFATAEGADFCLPNLVVMGSQKAGTTALHSYLMLSESLFASKKKELHVWDTDKQFKKWGSLLRSNFPGKQSTFKTAFETTPSYIASTMACQRMSTWLPPWTTFVVILRNPVERLWSEYQMKARRIRTQDLTMMSLIGNKEALIKCMEASKSIEDGKAHVPKCWDALMDERYGKIVGTGPKLTQVRSRLLRLARNPSNFVNFKKECIQGASSLHTIELKRECFHRHGILLESLPDMRVHVAAERADLRVCTASWFDTVSAEYTSSSTNPRQDKCKLMMRTKWCPHCYDSALPREQQTSCEKKCAALDAEFFPEAIRMGCTLNNLAEQYPPKRLGSPTACEGDTCKCYPKARNFADISRNFLWRGLYYPQLVNCMRHIPKDQILVIENNELRHNTNETLNKILRAANLPEEDYSQKSWEDAETAFALKYPNFESVTGWSADGSSKSKMPQALKEALQEFYHEPNERLFELIGRRFDNWQGNK